MLIKKENFHGISDAELFAFQSKYGEDFDVCPRRFAVGTVDTGGSGRRANSDLPLVYQDLTETRAAMSSIPCWKWRHGSRCAIKLRW